jgi:protein-S-isoprenylcysteine O-methyltransferase Ste14
MSKVAATIYGIMAYLVFVGVFLYALGFVGNYLVPKSIDSGTRGNVVTLIAINLGLMGLFAFQHSLMTRPFFKTWWEKFVPAVIERSTYVLLTSLILALLFWQWQPLKDGVWEVVGQPWRLVLQLISLVGWLIVLSSTFMINHFELFGLRQIYLNLKGAPYRPFPFTVRYLYRFVRHPLMLGFIVAFWATPDMTAGHFIFAVASTGYILIGI